MELPDCILQAFKNAKSIRKSWSNTSWNIELENHRMVYVDYFQDKKKWVIHGITGETPEQALASYIASRLESGQ